MVHHIAALYSSVCLQGHNVLQVCLMLLAWKCSTEGGLPPERTVLGLCAAPAVPVVMCSSDHAVHWLCLDWQPA